LGAGSNGINPQREVVVLQIGSYFTTIPAGSFQKQKQEEAWDWKEQHENVEYEFHGKTNGVELAVRIRYRGGKTFDMSAEGKDVNIGPTTSPITLGITIGDDGGGATILAMTGF
jgi:hypothetical protein